LGSNFERIFGQVTSWNQPILVFGLYTPIGDEI
jgi:hypothetical protein